MGVFKQQCRYILGVAPSGGEEPEASPREHTHRSGAGQSS